MFAAGQINGEQDRWYWYGDRDLHAEEIKPLVGTFEEVGLSEAYIDPPYGLHATEELQNSLFFEVVDRMLGGLMKTLTIYKWNPECSNYFDAGREWWGCYFWTVNVVGTDRIVVIAASSSD